MTERVRIVIADDHPVYREGVAAALRAWPELDVLGAAADGRAALALMREHAPDVALIDLQLPELDGLRILDAVRRDELPTQVLLISAFEEAATVYRAFSLGARGFLPKHATAEEIARALMTVASGGAVIPPHLAAGLAGEIHKRRDRDEAPLLTAREREMLGHAADGRSVKQTAETMHLSVATVKTHLQNAYEKLAVTDRTAAVAKALRQGLLD